MKLWKLKDSYIASKSIISESEAGLDKYVASDSNPDSEKYEDYTSIENVYNNIGVYTDYLQMRKHIDDLVNIGSPSGWNTLTDNEKKIFIDLHLRDRDLDISTNDTNKVVFLMGQGMIQQEAQGYLLSAYAEHHLNDKIACTARANSKTVTVTVAKYLNLNDATDFINESKGLIDLYTSRGIKGINYDSFDYGLFDYFLSTVGSPYEHTGLASNNYTLNTGTLNDFINELLDVLWLGKY